MKIRKHIYFSGRVQGVGFRYRARYLASGFGLTGWVKNLPDYRVEMEVQGEEALIGKMISMLEYGHYIEITGMTSEKLPLAEEERSFRVLGY